MRGPFRPPTKWGKFFRLYVSRLRGKVTSGNWLLLELKKQRKWNNLKYNTMKTIITITAIVHGYKLLMPFVARKVGTQSMKDSASYIAKTRRSFPIKSFFKWFSKWKKWWKANNGRIKQTLALSDQRYPKHVLAKANFVSHTLNKDLNPRQGCEGFSSFLRQQKKPKR